MCEIVVRGAADMANVTALRDEILPALGTGRSVVVALDEVEKLDGAGIQLLFALKAFVERSGKTFAVSASAEVPRAALEMAGASALAGGVSSERSKE